MQLAQKISLSPEFSESVVTIGSTFSGTTICLADYLPSDQPAVMVIIEPGVDVVFTDCGVPPVNIKFYCQQGARVIYLLESYSQESSVIGHLEWYLEENSVVECILMGGIVTGALAMTIDMYLKGMRARASCYVLATVADAAQCTIKTRQIHTGEHTTSTVRAHSLVGAASFDYRGAIDIDQTSIHAKALQANKNILLSKLGKVVAIPTLQVRINKVHCIHGAAVGKLEAEHMIYLQTRGIDGFRARALLLNGFLLEALEGASEVSVRFVDQNIEKLLASILLKDCFVE